MMHRSIWSNERFSFNVPGSRKPDCFSKGTQEKEVELIFLLPTPRTKLRDMNGKSTCVKPSSQCLPEQSPSKGFDFGYDILFLLDILENFFCLDDNMRGGMSRG